MNMSTVVTGVPERDFLFGDILRQAAEKAIRIEVLSPPARLMETPLYSGRMWVEEVQPGLIFATHDLTYRVDGPFDLEIEPCLVGGLLISGEDGEMEVPGQAVMRKRPFHPMIAGFGEPVRYRRKVRQGQSSAGIGVNLRPSFFERFDDDPETARALEGLRGFLRPPVQVVELPRIEALVDMARAVLRDCYTGDLRRLAMEAAALTLVMELARPFSAGLRGLSVGDRHYRQAVQAKEIIDAALAAPPCMMELAREVGVNVTTLRESFRAVFGCTIFVYLREQRLRMGQIMLMEHGLRVSEVAWRVGFASPAAFTAAYRRQFGCAPRQDLAARRSVGIGS